MQLLIAPKDFHLIGRLLLFKQPALATQLYTDYQSEKKIPVEKDLSKIEKFFISFCEEQNLIPSEHRGAQYKRAKVDKQRLFIAVIILIYAPYLMDTVNKTLRVPNGLSKAISSTLKRDRFRISQMVDQAMSVYRVYDEFREESEMLADILTKNN